MTQPGFSVRQLSSVDIQELRFLNQLFADVFQDPENYAGHKPGDEYLRRILGNGSIFIFAAFCDNQIIGGLVAYELLKFEQERSEIYIYDLAVAQAHRRQGVATALIEHLRGVAAQRGAWVIYVQADYGDDPAIALYEKLGVREDVMHFDIAVKPAR